jgi:hypothetical protein
MPCPDWQPIGDSFAPSGRADKEAHDYAMLRMILAGVVPAKQQVLLEWQRDSARRETYKCRHEGREGALGLGCASTTPTP